MIILGNKTMTNCRHCQSILKHTFLDLGHTPLSNAYLSEKDLNRPEVHLPLKIKVCEKCWLVQTEDCTSFEKCLQKIMHIFQAHRPAIFHTQRIFQKK